MPALFRSLLAVGAVAALTQAPRLGAQSSTPATAAVPATVAAKDTAVAPDSLAGFYEGPRTGVGLEITVSEGKLYGSANGSQKLPLVRQAGTTYFVGREGDARTVTFVMGAEGRATAVTYRPGNGSERTFNRVP